MAHYRSFAAVVLACVTALPIAATEGCSATQDGPASTPSGSAGEAVAGAMQGGGIAGAGNADAGGIAGANSSAGAGGVTSSGGAQAAGGTTSSGGAHAAGGVTSSGGAHAAGGTTSSAGTTGASGSGASGAPYKGIANSPAAQIKALGATWCYNWGTTPKSTDCDDPYFVPMIWGSGSVTSALKSIGKAGYKTVLGFNEPNKSDQANLSVADALAAWPDLTSDPNIRVGSPAVSDDGRAWLEDFMTQAKQKNLRVDFIAMHWYGWNKGSCVTSQLEGAVNWASKWGLPVWITEFGCMGSSNPDEKTVLDFFNSAIPMLAKHPLVERYAWYPWNTYNDVYTSNTMTALGQAFAAAPPSRP